MPGLHGHAGLAGPNLDAAKLVGRFGELTVFNTVESVRRSARAPARSAQRGLCSGSPGPMPPAALEALERALCGVLERRYPGRRFAMKDELDSLGDWRAPAADADDLEDAA